MSFFSKLGGWIVAFVSKFGTGILAFVQAGAKSIAENGGDLLVSAARDAVLAAEKAGGNGDDKAVAAEKAVIGALVSKGVPIVLNAVRIAIENAVAEMNKAK